MPCVIGEYCTNHDFIHGMEAEELRAGIELIIEENSSRTCHEVRLRRLLDAVDARDSLAFIERKERKI